jgi:CPA2 family monovalent cation:H+ antiporter-2
MQISAEVLLRDWAWILIGTILLIIIKTLFIFLSALAVRVPLRTAIQIGFLLSQGSEFAFVIFGMPALRGALGPDLSALLITVVAASLALTPTLMSLGHRLAKHLADRYWQTQHTGEMSAPPPSAPIVIFGMGSVGRCVADALEAHGIPYTGIEMDHERFVAANANGYPVAFGDVGDLRLMEAIRMSERPSLVISIKRYEVSRDLTPILRERYPKLTRFIAVRNDEEKALFEVLGMRAVVLRSVPKGLDLAAVVLKAHGVSDEKVLAWMQEQQDQALAQASVEALAKAS